MRLGSGIYGRFRCGVVRSSWLDLLLRTTTMAPWTTTSPALPLVAAVAGRIRRHYCASTTACCCSRSPALLRQHYLLLLLLAFVGTTPAMVVAPLVLGGPTGTREEVRRGVGLHHPTAVPALVAGLPLSLQIGNLGGNEEMRRGGGREGMHRSGCGRYREGTREVEMSSGVEEALMTASDWVGRGNEKLEEKAASPFSCTTRPSKVVYFSHAQLKKNHPVLLTPHIASPICHPPVKQLRMWKKTNGEPAASSQNAATVNRSFDPTSAAHPVAPEMTDSLASFIGCIAPASTGAHICTQATY